MVFAPPPFSCRATPPLLFSRGLSTRRFFFFFWLNGMSTVRLRRLMRLRAPTTPLFFGPSGFSFLSPSVELFGVFWSCGVYLREFRSLANADRFSLYLSAREGSCMNPLRFRRVVALLFGSGLSAYRSQIPPLFLFGRWPRGTLSTFSFPRPL